MRNCRRVFLGRPVLRTATALIAAAALFYCGPAGVAGSHNTDCKWSVYHASQEFGFNYYVRWHFEDSSDFSQSFRNRIQDGATRWNNVDRMLYFGFESSPSSGADLEVRWRAFTWPNESKVGQTTSGFCPMTAVTMKFNSSYPWYTGTGTPSGGYDALSVAVHEFGHAVALGHSSYTSDVMFPDFDTTTVRRSLSQHDRAGISYLYSPAPYGGT